jgi:hypothetical protein
VHVFFCSFAAGDATTLRDIILHSSAHAVGDIGISATVLLTHPLLLLLLLMC